MVIGELGLLDFRNYRQAFVRFSDGINVLVGRNGQGKTNLLEALHVTTHLESFRVRGTRPMVRTGATQAFVKGLLITESRRCQARIELGRAGRKVWLDERPLSRTSEYVQLFYSLLFNADHLYRFRQFPAERRSFFDRYIAFIDSTYLQAARDLRTVLAQKNKALKQSATADLSIWNDLFIQKGYAILTKRRSAVEGLNQVLDQVYAPAAGRTGQLRVRYQPSLDQCREAWAEALRRAEPRERQLGYALAGPHRDDFRFSIDGERGDDVFSQGEYRIAFLSVLLGMSLCVQAMRGFVPVLILDDLFSELDPETRNSLSLYLAGLKNQVFISTTHGTEGVCLSAAARQIIEAGRIVT